MGTDSIMSLVTLAILLATASITLTRCQEMEISAKGLEVPPTPVKLDKNLRRALLKALTDLEAESAEQHKHEDLETSQGDMPKIFEDVSKKDLNKDLGIVQKSTFAFNGFPGDEEIPSEDKLQNSSFVEAMRYKPSGTPLMTIERASLEDARSFHVQNVVEPEEKSTSHVARSESKVDELETRSLKLSSGPSSVTKIESITLKPTKQISESLAGSASSGFAAANALIAPKPSVSIPTVPPRNNVSFPRSNISKENSEEVKIFQAPLVAAFTVQQDELGVPKSVVPIYRSPTDGQALTLQEQLEFKQQLLEKQLAELQQQQLHQTQFLVRQRQVYEHQLRQKQQNQYYFQEQTRAKQLEEQARLKQAEEQRRLKQLEEQRIKQYEEQRLYRFQAQHSFPQKQHFFEQTNNILTLQPPVESNVHLQPSVSLEVPSVAVPPPFQLNLQEQLRLQQIRQQQQQQQQQHQQQQQQQHQQQHQQHPQHQQAQQQQQQRLQQSFGSFTTDFQPPLAPATRFNRQEAFNSVGNFGFNLENKSTVTRNTFGLNVPPRAPTNFVFNAYTPIRQARPPTPARQIQHLLYQSGIAGELGNVQGSGGQEDLNIVSKVLALNVGAIPNKSLYTVSNHGNAPHGKTLA